MKEANFKALLPIGVFLVLYLGLGILFEYVLKVGMGFYNIPIVVVFVIALLVACVQNRSLSFDDKLGVMGKGVGDKNIITMVLIFLLAGMFVGVVGRSSAESVAYFMLSLIPAHYAVAVLFVVGCFVSVAMGTSVGTITLLTPIAVAVSRASGFDMALCVGTVMGGAMFGDNLSFISDTTIAACNGQGCAMKDKFKVNFRLVFPAALCVLAYYVYRGFGMSVPHEAYPIEWVKVLPYLVVLATAFMGFNVAVVLLLGILTSGIVGISTGSIDMFDWFGSLGAGMSGMGELIIITLMAGGMLELIRFNGGVDYIIHALTRKINGKKGAEMCIAALVSIANICTANNTIAIITVGPLANDIATKYGVDKRKSASILDTFSCVVQGFIPYGAQMLMAAKLASISPLSIIEYLYYPMGILAMALFSILARWPKKYS